MLRTSNKSFIDTIDKFISDKHQKNVKRAHYYFIVCCQWRNNKRYLGPTSCLYSRIDFVIPHLKESTII